MIPSATVYVLDVILQLRQVCYALADYVAVTPPLFHANLQILNSVVVFDAVLVVDYLAWQQRAAKMFGHNEAVLGDVTVFFGIWMAGFINIPISTAA
jgi:hypothetical protein